MTVPSSVDQRLLAEAESRLERAHGRYSGVQVAAAALDEAGQVHVGVNVENSSLGLTICAERNALAQAVAQGAGLDRPGRRIVAIAFSSNNPQVSVPCGACRQVLCELAPTARILYGVGGRILRRWSSVQELLPEAFDGSWTGESGA